jgi:hypothetical protein
MTALERAAGNASDDDEDDVDEAPATHPPGSLSAGAGACAGRVARGGAPAGAFDHLMIVQYVGKLEGSPLA